MVPPRLRLLDPSSAWSAGGATIQIHGVGFGLAPQGLTVHMHIPLFNRSIDVTTQSLNEYTASFIVPDLTWLIKNHVTILHVSVEIQNSGLVSANTLDLLIYPELTVKKISPLHIPLSATSYARIMLFLELRYVHCFITMKQNDDDNERGHLTSIPIFVRINYVSENTKIPLSVIRPAKWSDSSKINGDMLVEFQPPNTSIGVMTAEISFNKIEFFSALCYNVWRDFRLKSVKPKAVLVSATNPVEVMLKGEYFLETGEVVVRLEQPPDDGVPQGMILNAICKSATEISVVIPPKSHCGITNWTISCNRGEHYCTESIQCLLYRERIPQSLHPQGGSLAGGTQIHIHLPQLENDTLDSFYLLSSILKQHKVLRVKFEPEDKSLPAQVVWGEPILNNSSNHGPAIVCTAPSFDVKCIPNDSTFPVMVSYSVDGKYFSQALKYHYFPPYIVKSLSIHHGPNTGGTYMKIQMNRDIPQFLPISVKFSSTHAHIHVTVDGSVYSTDDNSTFIQCKTPRWPIGKELQLTKVQVSLNHGADYIPKDNNDIDIAAKFKTNLELDQTYLLFLFYPPPVFNFIWPTSASQAGGGILRLKGIDVVDHGGSVSVIFAQKKVVKKVRGFIESDPTRHSDAKGLRQTLFCVTPPFEYGLVDIYVSLNDQQYSKCCFANIMSKERQQFLFYREPVITCLSPISSPSQVSTTLTIHGDNFIDTGDIQVRFAYSRQTSIADEPHTVLQYVKGILNARGEIECSSPILKVISPTITSTIEISLNSCEFTGPKQSFSFYRRHTMRLVDPIGMAIELPTTIKIFLTPKIMSDGVKVRLKVTYTDKQQTTTLKEIIGPIKAASWTSEYIEFLCPKLSTLVQSPEQLVEIGVECALNNQHFLDVGNLLAFTVPYSIPKIERIWPVGAPFESATELHFFGSGFQNDHPIFLRLSIPGMTPGSTITKVFEANFISKEQITVLCPAVKDFTPKHHVQLNWLSCKSLPKPQEVIDVDDLPQSRGLSRGESHVRRLEPRRRQAVGGMKALPITIEISTQFNQYSTVPLELSFYTTPSITHVSPRGGFTTGGTVVELQVDPAQLQYLQVAEMMPVMFGDIKVLGHRKSNAISAVAPELPSGQHLISIAFNQQSFEMVRVGMFPVYFEAFEPPVVFCPASEDFLMSFGPIDGGTPVSIRGQGFVESSVTLVKFVFTTNNNKPLRGIQASSSMYTSNAEYIVEATFIDGGLIKCIAPPVAHPGIANIQISCNGQQYSEDSQLHFEYHLPTQLLLEPSSAKCGALEGGTPIILHVVQGLPLNRTGLRCMIQLLDMDGLVRTVPATFADDNPLVLPRISFDSPPWPHPTKVQLRLSLNNQVFYMDTGISFLYFKAPDPIASISPKAGPLTGNTRVVVQCDSLLETGDIVFKLIMIATGDSEPLEVMVPGRVSLEEQALVFETPPVNACCSVHLQLSLNGIDFSPTNPAITFQYYNPPKLESFYPQWGAIDAETTIKLIGEDIGDFGAPIEVQFTPWRSHIGVVVPGRVINDEAVKSIECVAPLSFEVGYARIEFSLNGQQFTITEYPDPRVVSALALHKTKPLYPFRFFTSPYFLATTHGSAGGGSKVMFCGGSKLSKVLARCDTKAYVQFIPVKNWNQTTTARLPDSMTLDLDNSTVTCRAPMFRSSCIASVDLILGEIRGVDVAPSILVKEKYYFYDAPTISEVVPSCGPMAGETILLLLGLNIFESHQIHVRFQAVANRHEFCVVRGHVSTILSDGSLSKNPLIQCVSPRIEVYDLTQPSTSAHTTKVSKSNGGRYMTMLQQASNKAKTSSIIRQRRRGKERDEVFKPKTLQSVQPLNTLLVNKSSLGNIDTGYPYLDVMVDFSLNGGEQYLPRGIPFRFYTPLDLKHLVYGPHHVPCKVLDEYVGMDAPPRLRKLVILGFESSTLVESKCIGVRFERVNGKDEVYIQPCTSNAENGEVTCAIPEFQHPGAYRLLFSLNSQQFTYLGDLTVHEAIGICSHTPQHGAYKGGSFLRFEVEIPKSIGEVSVDAILRRADRVVRQTIANASITKYTTARPQTPQLSFQWRTKQSHQIKVLILSEAGTRERSRMTLIPIATVRSRHSHWILQQVPVDMTTGVCLLDASLWEDDGVVLSVHLNDNYNTFRCVVTDPQIPTLVLLAKYTSSPNMLSIITPPNMSGMPNERSYSVQMIKHEEFEASPIVLPSLLPGLPDVVHWKYEEGFFWLISTAPQLLMLSNMQTLLHCVQPQITIDSPERTLWVVGALICRPNEPLVVIHVNKHIAALSTTLPKLAQEELSPLYDLYLQEDLKANQPTNWELWSSTDHDSILPLQLSVCFKLTDNSATMIAPPLSIQQTKASLASTVDRLSYEIVCELPQLPGKGQAQVWFGANGICFSPPIQLQIYDPSEWTIDSLEPPCGLLSTSMPLKIVGKGFLETNTISVLFSTKDQIVRVPGQLWVRYFVTVTVLGLSISNRLSGADTNAWYNISVQCADLPPQQTQCKRVLYQMKKDIGTLLWGEKMQFELTSALSVPRFVLCLRASGDDGENTKATPRNGKEIGTYTLKLKHQEVGNSMRYSCVLENVDSANTKRQVDLSITIEPPFTERNYIVAQTPSIDSTCALDVQITCGQSCPTKANHSTFHVYELPTINALSPVFLPYSTGGDVIIKGRGFFDSGMICLRIVFLPAAFDFQDEPHASIQTKLDRLQINECDIQEIPCTFHNTTEISTTLGPRLKSHNVVFSLSFDRHTFTKFVPEAICRLYDILAVHPDIGPTQGHTYIALHGTNLSLCQLTEREPMVRFSFYRNGKLLERTVFPGQLTSGSIYCYTPPCKVSLEALHLELDIAFGTSDAPFTQDSICFNYYRPPLLKSIAPKLNLVPGCTEVYLQIVESWENNAYLNGPLMTARFRIKGQAQSASTSHNAVGVIQCRLPRFTVPVAVPQLLPDLTGDDCVSHKVWVRNSGLFVTVLRARNLRLLNGAMAPISQTNQLLRPFVSLEFENQKLRTTLREFTANPQYFEQFDLELSTEEGHIHGDLVITVQSEAEASKNEVIGSVRLPFNSIAKALKIRAWFPLHRSQVHTMAQNTLKDLLLEPKDSPNRGEIELFIHFQPMLLRRAQRSAHDGRRLTRLANVLKKTIHVETALRRKVSSTSANAEIKAVQKRESEAVKNAALLRLLGRQPAAHIIPTEMIIELALNGQDFISQCITPYTVQPLPIIEDITPKCLPSCGGSKLLIQGYNFIDTKCIRLAFLWGIEHYAELHQSFRLDANVCVSVPFSIVDATYESNTLLSCITPPTKRTTKASFTVIVALNGVDFNSIFLSPSLQSIDPENELSYRDVMELWSILNDKSNPDTSIEQNLPHHRWLIYETPMVHHIESASPTYTTKLLIHGENFVPTDTGKAKFIHELQQPNEIQCEDAIVDVRVLSTTVMECYTPDFPPGTLVRVCIAMNGLDFIPMPDATICICNAPKITKLVPPWAYSMGEHPLYIHGSNLMETGCILVSFVLESLPDPVVVRGECVNGVVRCTVPPLHRIVPNGDISLVGSTALVDVSLCKNGITEYTEMPLLLNLFHDQPVLDNVSPFDGPIWGGVTLKLRGKYFVNSPSFRIRFTRLQYDAASKSPWTIKFDPEFTTFADVQYKSQNEVVCTTPAIKDEGPVAVQLTLNGIDFSPVHDATWFVVWRNWKMRVQIIRQSLHHDGGAREAWFKYLEWKRGRKMNFYSGHNTTTSLKIIAAHSPTPMQFPKRVNNLPEIIRQVEAIESADSEDTDDQDGEMYIPPSIVWPYTDNEDQKHLRLLDRLKAMYRSTTTQADIYSRLIFVFDNTATLNAKYTRTAQVPTPPTPVRPLRRLDIAQVLRSHSFNKSEALPARRKAHSGIDLSLMHRKSALCYNGLCEGLRWIFPAIEETELLELWAYLDTEKIGKITLDDMCTLLQKEPRPPSPEPGPMHYNPQPVRSHISVPEMREDVTPMPPIKPQPILDVGPIIDSLHPLSPRITFSTTNLSSWCDPVYAGEGSEIAKPGIDLVAQEDYLSKFPRIMDTKFAPLTEEEEVQEVERHKPKPPAPSFGITALKLKHSSPLHAKMKRKVQSLSNRPNASTRQLQLLTAIIPPTPSIPERFRKQSTATPSKPSRPIPPRQTRLDSISKTIDKKHLKDVKPVYLSILRAKTLNDDLFIVMSGIPNVSTRIVPRTKGLKESGSCFDTTQVAPRKKKYEEETYDADIISAFSLSKPIKRETTDHFLKKGAGYGGHADTERLQKRDGAMTPSPRKERHQPGAFRERANPPDTSFRKFYERGDLPIQIDHGGVKNLVAWKVDITKLDFHHYLPIFFDGLREIEEPYAFLSEQGIKDMMVNASSKVLPVIPQLIIPIKNALNTRKASIIVKTLHILQLMVTCDKKPSADGIASGGLIGQALVPYYRQILPILNIFVRKNDNLGDGIDYSQRKQENLGDLIQQTLEIFELNGGDDAFINIKYLIPTYQSVCIG